MSKTKVKSPSICTPTKGEVRSMKVIVDALEFLYEEAERRKFEDIEGLLRAAHKICLSNYYLLVRGELVEERKTKH